jgi:gliding motility-associated-like protein
MAKNKCFYLIVVILLSCSFGTSAQIVITPGQIANVLAQKLVGTGVSVTNPTLSCASGAEGVFTVISSNLGLDSGIVLTSGSATAISAPATASTSTSTTTSTGGDPDLTTLATVPTYDKCVLEFDFIPAGDTIKFDYVFASEEYPEFACSSVNDVFGFFISGPGITGPFANNSKNIALVPGTNIPVSINTINSAPIGTGPISVCNAMGPGSPFNAYYIDNSPSTTVMYDGITTVLTAISPVIPCTTYHLRLAIADGGDSVYDSGVFLKAGSLTSAAVSITPVGGGGLSSPLPYCVRGCLPGQFVFNRPVAYPTPLTIHYQIAGSAVNGVDYAFIPDSVTIPANQTSIVQNIFALPANPPTGPKLVQLYVYSPYSCGGNPMVIDSAELTIYDSIQVNIGTPDTAICKYQSVHIMTQGDSVLSFLWTPSSGLDSINGRNPTATPLTTTTYTVAATISGSGCPPAHDQITITIREEPVVDAGPDITTCLGVTVPINLSVTPTTQAYTYTWSPGTYLSATNIPNPISNPTADITYYVKVDPGAAGCFGYDTLNIHVLPNDFNLFNNDTSICKGASVVINAVGDTAFTYKWSPTTWVSDPNIIKPIITPDTSQQYTLTASFPGCPNIVKTLFIDVQPNPIVSVGPDREKCQFDTIQLHAMVSPYYPFYSYSWTPSAGINNPTAKDVVYSGDIDVTPLLVTVKTPAGCMGSDYLTITVRPGNFGALAPQDTGICPRSPIKYTASGGVSYNWTPALFLDDPMSATPVADPITNVLYQVVITDQYGCTDTFESDVTVHPDAVLDLGETVTLYPGDNVQMNPTGNVLYYNWFPPHGLSSTTIANPIAMPEVNTRYFVTGTTEWGCEVRDSIDVMVENETLLDVPNAFSPGSQPNSEIKIIKHGIATLKYFRIFNRWGSKVFETSDIDKGWNGTLNGTPQPVGVYVYMVEAYTKAGKRFYKQGNITLIR